jgi:hypothetical protein
MSDTERYTEFYKTEFATLMNKTIIGVRDLTAQEREDFMWGDYDHSPVFLFNDNTFFILSKDEEGNGGGFGFVGSYVPISDASSKTARQRLFGEDN